ncbi:hypothetical protein GCM10011498_34940 [Amylibacter cionae]|uniref:Uncharacterized protein n=1 Tax=Neptunicoccus cionae TaxID=2035344 RepID=A0A916R371_9RHOB|nr:hypothetical protein GCM10011498_34940 [Amylibacter cionae]
MRGGLQSGGEMKGRDMLAKFIRIILFLSVRLAFIVWPFTLAAALFIYLKYF